MTQRTDNSLIFGRPAWQTASRQRLFNWNKRQIFEILTHIREHPYPEEKYKDLDVLLKRLDLDGYGPEIKTLDGEMVSAMINRKVKWKIHDLRKQLMRGYVPPQPSTKLPYEPQQELPYHHQQQPIYEHYQPPPPQYPLPVKKEEDVGDDYVYGYGLKMEGEGETIKVEDGPFDWYRLPPAPPTLAPNPTPPQQPLGQYPLLPPPAVEPYPSPLPPLEGFAAPPPLFSAEPTPEIDEGGEDDQLIDISTLDLLIAAAQMAAQSRGEGEGNGDKMEVEK
ncbi:hypothetical protein F5Y14DRAFT_133008 [Nemania sp. NC0429]|nr:hypothetical protein F5Y14DRAFT_133008 [Nemania sp. NC0429]